MNRSTTSSSDAAAESVRRNGAGAERQDRRDSSTTFRGPDFTLDLDEAWTNETVYRLHGPTVDGYEHTLQVAVNPEVGDISVVDYATLLIDRQLRGMEDGRLLETTRTKIESDLVASRVLLEGGEQPSWTYQEDWYIVHRNVGYRLSARFTDNSRQILGPQVEQIFRSFEPRSPLEHRH
jgi:hypothetical protein